MNSFSFSWWKLIPVFTLLTLSPLQHAAETPRSCLSARLELDNAGVASLRIKFHLFNRSYQPVHVLVWNTPLEGMFNDIFEVQRSGTTLKYMGPMVKRGTPTTDEYLLIQPGETATKVVDIDLAYDISAPGSYSVNFKGVLHDVIWHEGESKGIEPTVQYLKERESKGERVMTKVTSTGLTFDVDQSQTVKNVRSL